MKLRSFYLTLFCVILLSAVSTQVFAKDTWVNVRSKNFFLIGNADEKEIRQVATKLEQFRETFRQLFPNARFTQSIQTNVVVFKSDSAYRPFKPKRADGKPDDGIAGYFQPGEDINYITLSTGGEKEDTYGTIFHEYVHFLLDTHFGKSEVPPWFNEGLAEYYQTFKIEQDQNVKLGLLQDSHLYLLQQNKLMPLKNFFEIDNYSLHQGGNHSRSIFYAQAWALIHYLIQANKGVNSANMNKFLNLVMRNVEPEKAFQQAFQMDYATMEKTLRNYVEQRSFVGTLIKLPQKLVFDAEMTTIPLSDSEANAYLGDLLYHTHEYDDAETYLQKAVALDANSSLANTSLGLVKMRQRKFTDAKNYLEKAIAGDQKNHFAYYNYAYILSRESMDEFGYVRQFPPEPARKMRDALQKSIAINPNFAQSYNLLAFVNMVNGENLDESIEYLKKALALQPGSQDFSLQIAQIYMRQQKIKEAKEITEKIAKTADEPALRSRAQNLLNSINQFEAQKADYDKRKADYDKQLKDLEEKGYRIVKKDSITTVSEEEVAKMNEENEINSLNRIIEKPKPDEKQILGNIEKVACVKGEINYTVKTGAETIMLSSKDFTNLNLNAMIQDAQSLEFGCDAVVKDFLAVMNYRPTTDPKAKTKGTLLYIAFVPKNFRFKSEEEMNAAQKTVYVEERKAEEITETPQEQRNFEEEQRKANMDALKQALRTPLAGEKRAIGIVEKLECSGNSVIYVSKIDGQTLKLKSKSPQDVKMTAFTPDASGLRFSCGVKLPPVPAVITYRPKDKDGEIVALEFVPATFKLD